MSVSGVELGTFLMMPPTGNWAITLYSFLKIPFNLSSLRIIKKNLLQPLFFCLFVAQNPSTCRPDGTKRHRTVRIMMPTVNV